jgi:phosphopantothenoylcysteine decarboxylase/phosphopantothenate--cysteine ligase
MNDLHVIPVSDALHGRSIDVVVTGSIGAVESVRLIRSLRRLGADVTPWLSQGGAQFVTPMSLTWAAARDAVTGFSGSASHICLSDAVLIAPASASMLTKIARGMTDSHCTALVASALGQKKPVIILPTMHDSLREAPALKEHTAKIKSWDQVFFASVREEEGKQKFPEPSILADEAAHIINRTKRPTQPVLVTMGTTRGYIDDVRYISNYSSGKLGTIISEELYRQGFATTVIAGPCQFQPRVASQLIHILTTGEMLSNAQEAEAKGLAAGVFCASVLDYEPSEKSMGKIKSGQQNLSVNFKPTPKIIEAIKLGHKPKIGFKLEIGLSSREIKSIAQDYMTRYNLSLVIVNELAAVSATKHHGFAVSKDGQMSQVNTKDQIAQTIVKAIS